MLLHLVALVLTLALGVLAMQPRVVVACRCLDRRRRAAVLRRTPGHATWEDVAEVLGRELGPLSVTLVVARARAQALLPGRVWQVVDAHGTGPGLWQVVDAPAGLRDALWHLRTSRHEECAPARRRTTTRGWKRADLLASRAVR